MANIAITSRSICIDDQLRAVVSSILSDHELSFLNQGPFVLRADEVQSQLAESAEDIEALLVGRECVGGDLLTQLTNLRAVSLYGVGSDNIDFWACDRRSLAVLQSPGVNADAVVELAVGLMISVLRNVGMIDRQMHAGGWLKNGGTQLCGKTVGIIGAGHIGSRLAMLLRRFNCQILISDIVDKSALVQSVDGQQVDFETLLKNSDVVTLHVPLTEATENLMNHQAIGFMKTGAFLFNTSRGKVVDIQALVEGLESGQLAGVGFDVFPEEPVQNERLLKHPRSVFTSHIGGNSEEAKLAMAEAAALKLKEFFAG